MNPTRSMTVESARRHFYRRALPAYLIFLFCCTHFPGLRLDIGIHSPDKLAHFTAFGLLAFFYWRFAETFGRPLSRRFVWSAGAWLALYAAFDEYTQRYVGRGVDLRDWLLGVAGIAVALLLLEWRRRRAGDARL